MADRAAGSSGISLATALSSLPLESPEHTVWPLLRAQLGHSTRRPRWPYALAAGLLALALLPRDLHVPANAPMATASTASEQDPELLALTTESARLERLLAALSDDGASSASATALSLEFEDRLHSLDVQLQSIRDPGGQLRLWRQRVQLLRHVAALETSRRYLAAEGRSFDVAAVSAY